MGLIDTDEIMTKIIEDLDARIDNQLKILAGICKGPGSLSTVQADSRAKFRRI